MGWEVGDCDAYFEGCWGGGGRWEGCDAVGWLALGEVFVFRVWIDWVP